MCIPFHTLPTRLTKAVSVKFKKKQNAKRNVYSVSPFPHGLQKPFHKQFKKKKPKRNVYSVSHFPHGLQKPFHKQLKKKAKQVCSVSPFWKFTPKTKPRCKNQLK